jgi:hypothetical protein
MTILEDVQDVHLVIPSREPIASRLQTHAACGRIDASEDICPMRRSLLFKFDLGELNGYSSTGIGFKGMDGVVENM